MPAAGRPCLPPFPNPNPITLTLTLLFFFFRGDGNNKFDKDQRVLVQNGLMIYKAIVIITPQINAS